MKHCTISLILALYCLFSPTNAAETTRESGSIILDMGNGVTMQFVRIKPAGLWVACHEVTNRQYKRYDAAHVSKDYFQNTMDDNEQPVVMITWRQARDFTDWMTRRFADQIPMENIFRLPLEEEWAVFAACGDNRIYPWGSTWPPPDNWNYRGEEGVWAPMRPLPASTIIRGHTDSFITSAPVQESGKNNWGLYGVGGNVWEWCLDTMRGSDGARVLRGASWHNYLEHHLRLAYRTCADPDKCNAMIGFRVVIGKPVDVRTD